MDKIIGSAVGGAVTAVLAWMARFHDPFYSDGWYVKHPEWLLIPGIVALAAIIISLWNWGLAVLVVLALVAGWGFSRLYDVSDQTGDWPANTFMLHLIFAALAAGIIGGGARLVFVWWRSLPPSPPPPAPTSSTKPP